jgi:hypothetical protein
MLQRIAMASGLAASLLFVGPVQALTPGDLLVADGSRRLVAIDPATGAQSSLPLSPIGTGEISPGVGVLRRGGDGRIALAVAPAPNIPLSEVRLGRGDVLDDPLLVWTVPDVLVDVDGSSDPDVWYAVGDRLWQLRALATATGWIGVARELAEVAGPFRRATAMHLHEKDDGGGGKTIARILVAAGGDGVLSWNPDTGALLPVGGSPASPTPPNDLVWAIADSDDSPLSFGTTQLQLAGTSCSSASGFYPFALLGFGPAATGGLLQCALALAFANATTAYATAVDDLFVGGNPRVVQLTSTAGVWSQSLLTSGPPLSSPIDLEVVEAPTPAILPSPCDRVFFVNSSTDAADAAPGDHACATGSGACTLRAAVMESNAVGSRDCIWLPAGTFLLTLTGVDDAAERGDLDLLDDVVIRGAGIAETILDGGGIDRLFDVPWRGAGSVVLSGMTIRNGFEVYGGGIWFDSGGVLALEDVAMRENVADLGEGGAIRLGEGSAATIRRSAFTGNRALSASAIYAAGPLVVEDSTISSHDPEGSPSAVVFAAAPTAFVRSTFDRNEVGSLGCVVRVGLSVTTLQNVTFSGNRGGRGAACSGTSGRLALWNVTIALHEGSPVLEAGGGQVELLQSVVGVPVGGGPACLNRISSRGNNVDPDGTCIGDGPGDRPARASRLGPLADHGGPTRTHAPRAGSPVLDAGRAGACPARDQRGSLRPRDGDGDGTARCDVGAVELVPEPEGLAGAALATLGLWARRRRAHDRRQARWTIDGGYSQKRGPASVARQLVTETCPRLHGGDVGGLVGRASLESAVVVQSSRSTRRLSTTAPATRGKPGKSPRGSLRKKSPSFPKMPSSIVETSRTEASKRWLPTSICRLAGGMGWG